MTEQTEKMIAKKMIDADLKSRKELAKAVGMKYDTLLVRFEDPGTLRAFEIVSWAEALNLSDEEILQLVRG